MVVDGGGDEEETRQRECQIFVEITPDHTRSAAVPNPFDFQSKKKKKIHSIAIVVALYSRTSRNDTLFFLKILEIWKTPTVCNIYIYISASRPARNKQISAYFTIFWPQRCD